MNTVSKRAHLILILILYVSFLISYGVYYLSYSFIDLPSFYVAAETVFKEGGTPYDLKLFQSAEPATDQYVFPFLYPPPSLLLLYPYTLVSYAAAGVLTLILNHLLIIVFMVMFLNKILNLDLENIFTVLAVAYILFYHPLVVTLSYGQINLIVLVLLCLTWIGVKRESASWLVAIPLSLAILLKTYPAVFLLYFLAKKKVGILGWAIVLVGLFSVFSYLILPGSVWSDWVTKVLPTGGYGKTPYGLFSPAGSWNQSVNGFTSRLFLPNEFSQAIMPSSFLASVGPYMLSGAVILIAFWLTFLSAKHPGKSEYTDLEFSLYLLTMFLIAPISWEHHLVFVLPAAMIGLKLALETNKIELTQIILIFAVLLLAWRFPMWAKVLKEGILTLGISLKFYATVFVWAFFALLVWRRLGSENLSQHEAMNEAERLSG